MIVALFACKITDRGNPNAKIVKVIGRSKAGFGSSINCLEAGGRGNCINIRSNLQKVMDHSHKTLASFGFLPIPLQLGQFCVLTC